MELKKLPVVLSLSIVIALVLLFFIIRSGVLDQLLRRPGSEDNSGTGQITLEYWGMFEPEEAMQILINQYERETSNVKINYTQRRESNLSDYKTTLRNRIVNNSGPDIFRIHATWTPEYVRVLDPSPNINTATFQNRFYPSAQMQCVTSTGDILCIPLMYDGLVLIYNREMFSSAGIGVPTTWDDVRNAAERLTIRESGRSGEIIRAGIALGTSNNIKYSSDILGMMLAQSQVKIPDSLDTDAAAAALTFYTNFARENGVWSSSMPNSIIAFGIEETAMVFGKSSDILEILELNPTISMGILPVPQIPDISGQTTRETWASFWVEGVSSYSSEAEQRAAWDFLAWLSQPEQQERLYGEISQYRRFGPVYSDRTMANKLENNIYLANIVQQAEYSVMSVVADNSGNDDYAQLLKTAIANTNTGNEPLEELKKAKTEFTNLLRR